MESAKSEPPGSEPISERIEASPAEENKEYKEIKRRAKAMTFRARQLSGQVLEKTNLRTWIKRFMPFDELIGLQLTVALYYIGMVLIVVTTIYTMIRSLGDIGFDFLSVLGTWLIAPLTAIIALMLLRLLCERMYVYFKNRIGTPGATVDNMAEDIFDGDD